MYFSIHKDVKKSHDAHKMHIAALHVDIQEAIKTFCKEYSLLLISRYVYCHVNEWYLFLYIKGTDGINYRIDCQLF